MVLGFGPGRDTDCPKILSYAHVRNGRVTLSLFYSYDGFFAIKHCLAFPVRDYLPLCVRYLHDVMVASGFMNNVPAVL